jgi:hypothetical protein
MYVRFYIHARREMKRGMGRRRHPAEIHTILGYTGSGVINIFPQEL